MAAETGLSGLLEQITACRACAGDLPHLPRPVVRVGPDVRILICGQAPGRRVHESGLPFDDPSGDRLRRWMGVDRTTFYGPQIGVAAMAFCYPGTSPKGGDYPPPPRCAALWREQLMVHLADADLVLLVGTYAQAWHLGEACGASLTHTIERWRDFTPRFLTLPHPSWRNTGWLKRHPHVEAEIVPWLQERVQQILKR